MRTRFPVHTKYVNQKWYCYATFDYCDWSFEGDTKEEAQEQMKFKLRRSNRIEVGDFLPEKIYDDVVITKSTAIKPSRIDNNPGA